jgi:hypothetical protein
MQEGWSFRDAFNASFVPASLLLSLENYMSSITMSELVLSGQSGCTSAASSCTV